ncbi:MAG: ATP-binding cassette domain-containing protein, partial [Firmicutes bacterium]|nr:ATP-binding cassette domain-containing protein [Bacillota bacterium]
MNMLEVRDLSVRFGPLEVVKNVSFSVEEGEWLMIVGPNGAGKSTIVNAISQGA